MLTENPSGALLHAPRQTGKPSSLLALADYLNRTGRYRSVYTNVEPAQAAREDLPAAMRAILSALASRSRHIAGDSYPGEIWPAVLAESIRMGNFDAAGVTALYLQHTAETGQPFTPEALARVWDLTRGQPWLVNALGYQLCFRDPPTCDRAVTVTAEHVEQAREVLIQRRDTHLDQLADKLREPRVRRVIAPLLAGEDEPGHLPVDDVQPARNSCSRPSSSASSTAADASSVNTVWGVCAPTSSSSGRTARGSNRRRSWNSRSCTRAWSAPSNDHQSARRKLRVSRAAGPRRARVPGGTRVGGTGTRMA